jgi:hypothetical protein
LTNSNRKGIGEENILYTQVAQKTHFVSIIHHLPLQYRTHYQNKTKPPDYMRKEKRKKRKMRERREGRNKKGGREVQTHGWKKEEETLWVGGTRGRPWVETL